MHVFADIDPDSWHLQTLCARQKLRFMSVANLSLCILVQLCMCEILALVAFSATGTMASRLAL